ncbi:MAG: MerR family transcriptional regulator [Caulobacteraceae bacterium]|nr:MerR family transcriptional regulator [Caulobacteraceae bacterium]
MQELEARTGVGRETIRYYIRLGLLPEPQRPKPNVAVYDETHVRRVEVIRRLQQTRYLPLAFIKTLLDRRTGGEIEALPGLESRLAARLGVGGAPQGAQVADAPALTGLSPHDLEVMIQSGVVKLAAGGGLDAINLAICQVWGRAKAAGYTEENGWFPEDLTVYAEAIESMARLEVERFYTRVSGLLGVEEAAALGQVGVEAINELLALLRTRALLAWAAQLNAQIAPTRD